MKITPALAMAMALLFTGDPSLGLAAAAVTMLWSAGNVGRREDR